MMKKAIGSLILITIIAIILLVLLGVMAYIISTEFTVTTGIAAVNYNTQYLIYANQYQQCLRNAQQYGLNTSICNILTNITNQSTNNLMSSTSWINNFSNPILWIIIFVVIITGVYVGALQKVQHGK
jgi:predicted PurR-regulated permease PerM